MGSMLGERRVQGAAVVALVLIGGALYLARASTAPREAQASEESTLLQAIATHDSTGDGLPDWEKALYGIPLNATTTDYFHLGMTDGEAVAKGLIVPKAIADVPEASTDTGPTVDPNLPPAPAEGTLTAAFAKNLFTLYLQQEESSGGTLTAAQETNVANEALTELAGSITPAPDFKSASDLTVSGTGPAAMKQFAASAEAVMDANQANATTSELVYLQDAVQNNDTSAITHIQSIAKAYRDSAAGLAALPVPNELASADLALVNALARTSEVVNDFGQINTDPLATMLAVDEYPAAVSALADAFIGVERVYQAGDVTFSSGEAGASFVGVITDVAHSEVVSTTTP